MIMKKTNEKIIIYTYVGLLKLELILFCTFIWFRFRFYDECKRRFNIKLWKTFTDCFNCLPVAAIGEYLEKDVM